MFIKRIFAGHQPGLATTTSSIGSFFFRFRGKVLPKAGQLEGIHANHAATHSFKGRQWAIAAVSFANAGDSVCSFDFNYGSQGIRRMQTITGSKWTIGHRDRMQFQFRDPHFQSVRISL